MCMCVHYLILNSFLFEHDLTLISLYVYSYVHFNLFEICLDFLCYAHTKDIDLCVSGLCVCVLMIHHYNHLRYLKQLTPNKTAVHQPRFRH